MDSTKDDIKERLNSAWEAGQIAEVCGILIHEVQEICVKWLLFRYRGKLSFEDCEDCFGYAVEKLLDHKQNPGTVNNPYSYLWTCTVNEANDMLAERRRVSRIDPDWLSSDEDGTIDEGITPPAPVNRQPDSDLYITEVALEEEIRNSTTKKVFKEIIKVAASRLTPKCREVVEILRKHNPSISNALLAELTGMSEGAARLLKFRAFRDLRKLIPQVARELGVDINSFIIPEPEIVAGEPTDLPSEDEDIDLIPPPI